MSEAIGEPGARAAPPCLQSERAFLTVAGLLFAAAAAVTIAWCGSMRGLPMCGAAVSASWARMPGEGWIAAAARFLGMWAVMMAAMMLPSLLPMLWRYRRVMCRLAGPRLDRLTAMAGLAYWLVWCVLGVGVFGLGAALASLRAHWPLLIQAAPLATGAVVVAAGVLQFSTWKARNLARCRQAPVQVLRAHAVAAWSHGLRLGLDCIRSCAGLTTVLLALGVMDLRVMAGVTAAISLERLVPSAARMAQAVGMVVIAAGLLLLAQATGLA